MAAGSLAGKFWAFASETFGAGGLLSSAEAVAKPGSHVSVLWEGISLAKTPEKPLKSLM